VAESEYRFQKPARCDHRANSKPKPLGFLPPDIPQGERNIRLCCVALQYPGLHLLPARHFCVKFNHTNSNISDRLGCPHISSTISPYIMPLTKASPISKYRLSPVSRSTTGTSEQIPRAYELRAETQISLCSAEGDSCVSGSHHVFKVVTENPAPVRGSVTPLPAVIYRGFLPINL